MSLLLLQAFEHTESGNLSYSEIRELLFWGDFPLTTRLEGRGICHKIFSYLNLNISWALGKDIVVRYEICIPSQKGGVI